VNDLYKGPVDVALLSFNTILMKTGKLNWNSENDDGFHCVLLFTRSLQNYISLCPDVEQMSQRWTQRYRYNL